MKEHYVLETLLILLCMSTVAGFRIQIADADIPSIVSVIVWTSGTHTMLNVTITHSPPPTIGPSHYVSIVQVDINGTTTDLAQSPQSTITFNVTYDMGEVTSGSTVRVRAFCTVHGWSDWSNIITVPEYSPSTLLLVLVAAALIMVAMKLRFNVPGELHKKRSVYCNK